jgi:hypothetical protein
MQHGVRQEERLCANLEGSGAGIWPDNCANSKGILGAGFKPCLCEILRPILRRANLRVFETPPVSGSEYWRLAVILFT